MKTHWNNLIFCFWVHRNSSVYLQKPLYTNSLYPEFPIAFLFSSPLLQSRFLACSFYNELLPGSSALTHFVPLLWNAMCALVLHSFLTLWSHGLYPTRLLCPWDYPGKNTGMVASPFSKGSSQPRNRTWVSLTAGRFFTDWATREALECHTDLHKSMT